MSAEYIENDSLPENLEVLEQIVLPVVRRLFCKKCKQELERSNEILLTSPLKYQYKCGCGVYYISHNKYPEFVYVNKDEKELTQ